MNETVAVGKRLRDGEIVPANISGVGIWFASTPTRWRDIPEDFYIGSTLADKELMKVTCWFDGACEPVNPGVDMLHMGSSSEGVT
jgi:hypothetical protein